MKCIKTQTGIVDGLLARRPHNWSIIIQSTHWGFRVFTLGRPFFYSNHATLLLYESCRYPVNLATMEDDPRELEWNMKPYVPGHKSWIWGLTLLIFSAEHSDEIRENDKSQAGDHFRRWRYYFSTPGQSILASHPCKIVQTSTLLMKTWGSLLIDILAANLVIVGFKTILCRDQRDCSLRCWW